MPKHWLQKHWPPKNKPLAIIDLHGNIIFETLIIVASLPVLSSVTPAIIEYNTGTQSAIRIQLNTKDAAFFSLFEIQAVLLNRTFPIRVSESNVYFDFETKDEPLVS